MKPTLDDDSPLTSAQAVRLFKANPLHPVTSAFVAYIGSDYDRINAQPGSEEAVLLTRFFRRLPVWRGRQRVYRGIAFETRIQREAIARQWRDERTMVVERTFMSTGKSATWAAQRAARNEAGLFLIVIRHRTGRDIEPLTRLFPAHSSDAEREVVFLRGTRFRLAAETQLELWLEPPDAGASLVTLPAFALEEIEL